MRREGATDGQPLAFDDGVDHRHVHRVAHQPAGGGGPLMRWRLLRAGRFVRRWSGTIVWVVTMTAVALLFARQQAISSDAEHAAAKAKEAAEQTQREAGLRTYSLCTSANETRKAVVDLFDYLAAQAAPLTPEQQATLDIIHERLGPLECPPEPK